MGDLFKPAGIQQKFIDVIKDKHTHHLILNKLSFINDEFYGSKLEFVAKQYNFNYGEEGMVFSFIVRSHEDYIFFDVYAVDENGIYSVGFNRIIPDIIADIKILIHYFEEIIMKEAIVGMEHVGYDELIKEYISKR